MRFRPSASAAGTAAVGSGGDVMTLGRSYEFRVEPAVPDAARDVFCDMDLVATPGGTVLRGTVVDDSHLHGILGQVHALGLTVIAARPLDRLPQPDVP
jgi:hypothetical protein